MVDVGHMIVIQHCCLTMVNDVVLIMQLLVVVNQTTVLMVNDGF